jgi:hypothetical protein
MKSEEKVEDSVFIVMLALKPNFKVQTISYLVFSNFIMANWIFSGMYWLFIFNLFITYFYFYTLWNWKKSEELIPLKIKIAFFLILLLLPISSYMAKTQLNWAGLLFFFVSGFYGYLVIKNRKLLDSDINKYL